MVEALAYDAFISYSHSADDAVAPRLQSGLHRFAKPWWKRQAVRVFRDESSLSANPHLWSSIVEAMDDSEWMVVLCSPEAASSEWVEREVRHWLEHKPPNRILPVVTEGEFAWLDGVLVSDSVPPSLRDAFSEEPRWVDLRFAHSEEHLDLKNPRFASAIADLASAVRGVPRDELESEEIRQHRRTVRTAWTVGLLILALGVTATALAFAMLRRSEIATARELAASSVGVLESDPELATLLAIEAVAASPDPQQEAVQALHRALQSNRIRTRLPWDGYEGVTGVGLGAAMSPDGDLVAVSEDGSSVDLWTLSGELVRTLSGGSELGSVRGGNFGISFNADGTRLAAVDPAGTVMIWDVFSGEVVQRFQGHAVGPGIARFSSDGRWLATVNNVQTPDLNAEIVVWDAQTFEEQWRAQMVAFVGQAAFAPDGESVAVGAWIPEENPDRGLAVVYDSATGDELARFVERPRISSVGYSHDGAVLGIPMWDGVVRLVSTGDYETIGRLSGGEVKGIAFSPVAPVVVGTGSQGMTVWDYETGRVVLELPSPAHAVSVEHPVFTADGTGVIQHGGIVWDLQAPVGEVLTLVTGGAVDAQFSPDGDRLIVNAGRGDSWRPPGTVTVHEFPSGRALISIPDRYGYYMGIGPDGDTVALFGPRGIALFDLDTGQRVVDLANSAPLLGQFLGGATAFSPDGLTVAAAGDGPFVGIWDVQTGEQIGELIEIAERDPETDELSGFTFALALTPDGDRLVSGDYVSGTIQVFDMATRQRLVTLDHGSGLFRVALSPDASLLASGSFDGSVKVWDLVAGEQVHEMRYPAWVKGLAFNASGDRLAVTSDDGVLTIWDVEAGTQELVVPAHHGWAFSVNWHPNGRHLATASDDGTVRVWTLDPAELVDIARSRVTRSLTEAECQTYLHIDTCPDEDAK